MHIMWYVYQTDKSSWNKKHNWCKIIPKYIDTQTKISSLYTDAYLDRYIKWSLISYNFHCPPLTSVSFHINTIGKLLLNKIHTTNHKSSQVVCRRREAWSEKIKKWIALYCFTTSWSRAEENFDLLNSFHPPFPFPSLAIKHSLDPEQRKFMEQVLVLSIKALFL